MYSCWSPCISESPCQVWGLPTPRVLKDGKIFPRFSCKVGRRYATRISHQTFPQGPLTQKLVSTQEAILVVVAAAFRSLVHWGQCGTHPPSLGPAASEKPAPSGAAAGSAQKPLRGAFGARGWPRTPHPIPGDLNISSGPRVPRLPRVLPPVAL